jgi:hypothetical protein
MTYILAATTVLALFVFASWKSRQKRVPVTRNGLLNTRPALQPRTLPDPERSPADVEAALQLALKRLLPVMQSRRVRTDVAVRPDLLVGIAGAPLTDLLEEFVAAAIHHARAHRLLITAVRDDEKVIIRLADNAPDADPEMRAGIIKSLAEKVASQGGTLEVDVRPLEGTMMTMRLPVASTDAVGVPAVRPETPPPMRSRLLKSFPSPAGASGPA